MSTLKKSQTLSGQKIRDTRIAKNINARNLAEKIGISFGCLLEIEYGTRQYSKKPNILNNIVTMYNICDTLEIPFDSLLELIIEDLEKANLIYTTPTKKPENFSKLLKSPYLLNCQYQSSFLIRQARLQCGLTMKEVAKILHMNRDYLTRLELGDYGPITNIALIINICNLLGISYDKFICTTFEDLKCGKMSVPKICSNTTKLLYDTKTSNNSLNISFPPSYTQQLENGHITIRSLKELYKIANEYKIPALQLFNSVAADLGSTSASIPIPLASDSITHSCHLGVGKLVRSARLLKGMMSTVASRMLNFSYRHYLNLEYGIINGNPFIPDKIFEIIKVCDLFNIPYAQMLSTIENDMQYAKKAASN